MPDDVVIRVRGDNRAGGMVTGVVRDIGQLRGELRQVEAAAERAEQALSDIEDTRDEIAQLVEEYDDLVLQMEQLQDSARQVEHQLDEVGDAGQEAGRDIDQGLEQADDGAGGIELSLDGLIGKLGEMGPAGAAAAAAIGVAMAGIGLAVKVAMDAVAASIERQDVGAEIAAQLGSRGGLEAVNEFGEMAGRVYARGFGESLEDAGKSITSALRFLDLDDATDEMIESASGKLSTLSHIFGVETNEIGRAVRKLMKADLVGSYEEAMDLLTRANEQGINEADDLIETMSEYPIQFKQLGISAADALGLMSQGLANAARDSDTVADTLKEIAIVAQTGDKKSAEAFKNLGLDVKKLAPMFAAGGAQAREALDMVLDKTKEIKDPMVQNAIATGLFGTKAEDLQDALFGMDLDTAASEMEGFEGATQRASDTLGSTLGAQIEHIKRSFEMLQADLGTKLGPVVQWVIEKFQELGEKIMPMVNTALEYIKNLVNDNSEMLNRWKERLEVLIPIIGAGLAIAIMTVVGAITVFIEILDYADKNITQLKAAFLLIGTTALNAFGLVLEASARAFGWIPGVGEKLTKASNEFGIFRDKVNGQLNGIQREVGVTIRAHTVGFVEASNRINQMGGAAKPRAAGGWATGLTMVGERGRELIDMGSAGGRVHNNATTEAMLAGAATGDGQPREMRLTVDTTGLPSVFDAWLRKAISVNGARSYGLVPTSA